MRNVAIEKLFILLKSSRPLSWIIGPLVFFLGLKYSGAHLNEPALLMMMLFSFPLSMAVFGINDVYDYASDRGNQRKKNRLYCVLDKRYHPIVRKAAYTMMGVILVGSLVTGKMAIILLTALLLFLSYFYSVPPIRLKEKPMLDSLSNGAIVLLVFMAGAGFGMGIADIETKIYVMALCVAGVHALGTVMDHDADRKSGIRTFSTVFGRRSAALFSLATVLIALFGFFSTPAINIYLVACSFIYGIVLIRPDEDSSRNAFDVVFVGFIMTGTILVMLYG